MLPRFVLGRRCVVVTAVVPLVADLQIAHPTSSEKQASLSTRDSLPSVLTAGQLLAAASCQASGWLTKSAARLFSAILGTCAN